MSQMTLVRNLDVAMPAPQPNSWLKSSVREFFTTVNWEDQSSEVQELKLSVLQGGRAELSLTLSVQQFFGAIAWDGNAVAAAPPPMEVAPKASANEMTLDAFSSLF